MCKKEKKILPLRHQPEILLMRKLCVYISKNHAFTWIIFFFPYGYTRKPTAIQCFTTAVHSDNQAEYSSFQKVLLQGTLPSGGFLSFAAAEAQLIRSFHDIPDNMFRSFSQPSSLLEAKHPELQADFNISARLLLRGKSVHVVE